MTFIKQIQCLLLINPWDQTDQILVWPFQTNQLFLWPFQCACQIPIPDNTYPLLNWLNIWSDTFKLTQYLHGLLQTLVWLKLYMCSTHCVPISPNWHSFCQNRLILGIVFWPFPIWSMYELMNYFDALNWPSLLNIYSNISFLILSIGYTLTLSNRFIPKCWKPLKQFEPANFIARSKVVLLLPFATDLVSIGLLMFTRDFCFCRTALH